MTEQRIPAGTYRGRAIRDSVQYGTTKNNNDQIAIDLALEEIGETATTFLIFTDASAPFALDRLRALGWEGDDLTNLDGIEKNEVNVQVKYEMWESKQQMRVEILTGGGRVVLQNTMDDRAKKAFAAKFKGVVSASKGPKPAGSGADFPYGANAPKPAAGGVKL